MNIVITIVGSAIVFLVVLGFAAYNRYLQHKETMALAEKGLLSPEDPKDKNANVLRWGMIFSILGVVLVLVMVFPAWDYYWNLFLLGLIPLALGLGLILIYIFTQDNPPPKEKKTPQAKKTKQEVAKDKKNAPAKPKEAPAKKPK